MFRTDRTGVVEPSPGFEFAVSVSGNGTGGMDSRWRGEEEPNLGPEESARAARLPLLAFVISLMSDVDTLHSTATDASDVNASALSIFTGTLEADAVCPRWAGSSLYSKPSFMV